MKKPPMSEPHERQKGEFKMAKEFEYCGYTAYKSQTARGRAVYEIYETATDTYCGDTHNKQDAKFMMKLWAGRKQGRAAC